VINSLSTSLGLNANVASAPLTTAVPSTVVLIFFFEEKDTPATIAK
jgi:hypothetical protein